MPEPFIFDQEYHGPRWRYGLQFRPLGKAQVPDSWILFSNRSDPRFAHGTVQYPRQLTDAEVARYELTFVDYDSGPMILEEPSILDELSRYE